MMKRTRRISLYGLLIALALVLSYVESLIPAFFAIPGMKLGLTNVVVLVALYRMDYRSAFIINIVRIILVAAMFGNAASLLYSLAGGVLSFIAMLIGKRLLRCSVLTVSALGGVFHNVGQILMAMLLLYTAKIGYYLAILWLVGIATGLVIGVISGEIIKRVPNINEE